MRKILLSLVTIFLLGFAIYIAIYGLNLGSIEIKSIPAIKEENAKLEQKITNASKLRNTDYTQSIASLENAYKKLMTEKDNYEQMLALGVDENGETLVLENTDNTIRFKFNSSDIYAALKEGETYEVEVIGYRVPFLNMYENIISYKEVK